MSDKPLTLGMVGEHVAALHQALTERGFSIPEAETKKQFFGPATRMTVGEFQKAHGIDPSCEVCMATAAKLGTTLAANAAANDNQPPVKVLTAQVGTTTNDNQPQGKVEYLQVGSAANDNQLPVQIFSSQVGTKQQPIQNSSKWKMPTHLSLFALAKTTGHPIARMPFYAEVGLVSLSRPPKSECKLEEVIRESLWKFYENYQRAAPTETLVEPLVELLCDALSRLLAQETIDRLAGDRQYAKPIISTILKTVMDLATGKNLYANDAEALRKIFEDAIRAFAKEYDLPLAGINTQEQRIVWAHPLGVLATDHVGYLSFDLTRLPSDVADAVALALEMRRRDPNTPTDTSIWIYPMAREESRIDALAQMRFAHDAIVVKLELDMELDSDLCQPKMCESIKNLGILAMQNPNLTDWRLSPGSFATNPGTLVGADGCETILPANIAVHDFHFYQVIRLTNVQDALPVNLRDHVMLGVVHEYRLAWFPLGHSLGQIIYSLPLAPGETVNLAVIDWTRRDDAQRKEHTTMDEQLVHDEHRDRTISETVNAAVHEYQHGSSFMAGIAGSLGAAGSYSGVGIAAGIAGSLGGSSASTSGSRDIAGSTVQRLSDNITQASSARRELQSTVVVQSTQSEKEAIETRTVVNYNHSHTLTILYYEVLRHFRVTTGLVRRRPAVLVKLETRWFEGTTAAQNILEHRAVLESALLDAKYAEGFQAIERLSHRRNLPPPFRAGAFVDFTNSLPDPPKGDDSAKKEAAGPDLRFFEFNMKTGGWFPKNNDQDVQVKAYLYPQNHELKNGGPRISPSGAFTLGGQNNSFVATLPEGVPSVRWGDIDLIRINVWQNNTDVSFEHIKVTAIDVDGNPLDLVDKWYTDGHLTLTNDWDVLLPTKRPQPAPPAPPYYAETDVADHAKGIELVAHLSKHKRYYSRAILLNQNSVERAGDLDDLKVLEHLDNRPLEIVGDYMAYPSTDPEWNVRIKSSLEPLPDDAELHLDERLVTLPTRGVFAEAKLGHCNASEEMDPTRFWKWEEHPIPHSAPEIAAIEAGKHTVINPNLQSTPFPQPIVNIVNPPNAPDPTGLANAMNVLATSNLFRDMSGRAEVADLLKKLSDNSVAIASVAQKAAAGGTSSGSGGGTTGTGGGATQPPTGNVGTGSGKTVAPSTTSTDSQSVAPPQQTPEQRASQQIDNQNKTLQMAKDQLPPPQQRQIEKKVTQDVLKKAPEGLGFLISFQTAVYGHPVDGSATIEIVPFGQRTGAEYNEGTTIGPPSAAQKTTIPETFNVKITNGTVMIQTDHASAPGRVLMTVYYSATPNIFVQVIQDSDIYNASTGIFTLKGGETTNNRIRATLSFLMLSQGPNRKK